MTFPRFLLRLFGLNGTSPMPQRHPTLSRIDTKEIEGAKEDVAEGIKQLRESRLSLETTLQQILLIQQETEVMLRDVGSREIIAAAEEEGNGRDIE